VPSFCVYVPWPSCCPQPRLVYEVLGLGFQAVVRGGARCAPQELDRGSQAVARGTARCVSQVLDRYARPLHAAALVVRSKYFIVAPGCYPRRRAGS